MRLLEYQVDKFFDECLYQDGEKHECAGKGFKLAYFMDKGTEFWLTSKDCTVKDFVQAVYKEVVADKDNIPDAEFFEILARFLCGYDKYENFKKEHENEKDTLWREKQKTIDDQITDDDLLNKIDYIEKCLENYTIIPRL